MKEPLALLRGRDIELDQRLALALRIAASADVYDHTQDRVVFLALCSLQPSCLAGAQFDFQKSVRALEEAPILKRVLSGEVSPEPRFRLSSVHLDRIFTAAIDHATTAGQLGTRDVLRAYVEDCFRTGDNYTARPYAADILTALLGGKLTTPLSQVPKAQELLRRLRSYTDSAEDFQYFVALEGDRLVFRVTGLLDDFVQRSDSGVLMPSRALFAHFRDRFGGFTQDEIEELEELMNNPKAKESQFQDFFERHPHFFRRFEHREVHPHVYLTQGRNPLVPDFILTDRELQRATVVDLKLATPKLIRRQHNRDRFAAAIQEARSQLLRYRDWFRDDGNRQTLRNRLGMTIYEPHLAVIIGRSSEFMDAFDRQRLRADNPDIEVVTYDDIVKYAERRRIVIQ